MEAATAVTAPTGGRHGASSALRSLGAPARFAVRSVASILVTMLVASFIVYGAMYLAPGSPIAFLTGGKQVSPETVAALERQYHLDDSFFVSYGRWLGGVVRGDFGTSVIQRQSVWSLIEPRLGSTAFLVVYSALLVMLFGLGGGILAALRPKRFGPAFLTATGIGMAIPAFVSSVVLAYVFGVQLGWLPSIGSGSGFGGRLSHLTLPAIALALTLIAYAGRVSRGAVAEELGREHVDTARARGLPWARTVRRHVLRNALIPIVTVGGVLVIGLIGALAIVESAFGLDGVGAYLIQAVQQKDFPVVQAIVLMFVLLFTIINTAVDGLYTVIDPRVAVGGKRR